MTTEPARPADNPTSDSRVAAFTTLGSDPLAAVDFAGVYQLHAQAQSQRARTSQQSVRLFAAPLLFLATLLSLKIVDPQALNTMEALPWYVYAAALACGLLGVIPHYHFIEINATYLRSARKINYFRARYALADTSWNRRLLPVDCDKPPFFSKWSWAGVHVGTTSLVNALYITFGIFGLDGKKSPLCATGALSLAATFAALYFVYWWRAHVSENAFSKQASQ